jgi:hypothetical protein
MFYHSTKPILRKQFSITFSSKMDENEHLVVRVLENLALCICRCWQVLCLPLLQADV